ncbi:hypothetical protein HYW21_03605 [Candidatus Woesearchaeota archaeon]|nr:hypothetical protein [Candidatus Woesearchaeota archaeon]
MIPLIHQKKALSVWEDWPEILAFWLLVLGFFIAAFARSAVMEMLIVFLTGMICGRVMYKRRKKEQVTFIIMIIGFALGFMIGSFYASRKWLFFLFIVGGVLSYYLHKKDYIQSYW